MTAEKHQVHDVTYAQVGAILAVRIRASVNLLSDLVGESDSSNFFDRLQTEEGEPRGRNHVYMLVDAPFGEGDLYPDVSERAASH